MKLKKLLLSFSFFFFSQFAFAQNSDFKKNVDDFLDYLNKENSFLGNIELKKGNELIYKYSSNPLEPKNSQYRIGSITKTFTSVVVFQLIEENIKLNL